MTPLMTSPLLRLPSDNPVSDAFAQFCADTPESVQRSSFARLDEGSISVQYPLQSWPTYVDGRTGAALEALTLGLARLVRQVPLRLLDGDADRVAEFYGLEPHRARLMLELLDRPEVAQALVSRGDFVETGDGLACVEWNFTSNLGGWRNARWAELYDDVPLLARFHRESGLEVRCIDTAERLFRNLLTVSLRHDGPAGEDLNLAYLVPPSNRGEEAWLDVPREIYRRALAEAAPGTGGDLLLGAYEDLEISPQGVRLAGRPVRIAVELYEGVVPGGLLAAAVEGRVLLVNGPVSEILDDKANLALLSEASDSHLLDGDDGALVDQHLPWTRVVDDGFTTWRGGREYLPDLVADQREALVLKPRRGGRGRDVTLGAFVSERAWEDAVDRALDEGGWVVQERLESAGRPLQHGSEGVAPHEVVWGLFAFGEVYGGGFLRMMPTVTGGVVNASRGASESVILEGAPR